MSTTNFNLDYGYGPVFGPNGASESMIQQCNLILETALKDAGVPFNVVMRYHGVILVKTINTATRRVFFAVTGWCACDSPANSLYTLDNADLHETMLYLAPHLAPDVGTQVERPQVYTIKIDETQRAIIQEALQLLIDSRSDHKHWDDLHLLHSMTEDLPKDEQEQIDMGHKPGTTVHGFAL